MGERAPYSRVYWSVVDDPKFATIFDDDHHLATWLRLLIAADAIWPASPSLPLSARRPSVKALADAKIVDLQTGHRYRIHGLDAERGRRKDAATTRGPSGTPNGTPDGDLEDTERSPDGPSRAGDAMLVSSSSSSSRNDEGGAGGNDDPAVAFQERTGEFPGAKMLSWIDDLAEAHGEARLAATIRATPMIGRNSGEYLRAVRDKLRAEDHAAEKREAEDERQRNAAKRAPAALPPVLVEYGEAIRQRYAAEEGGTA